MGNQVWVKISAPKVICPSLQTSTDRQGRESSSKQITRKKRSWSDTRWKQAEGRLGIRTLAGSFSLWPGFHPELALYQLGNLGQVTSSPCVLELPPDSSATDKPHRACSFSKCVSGIYCVAGTLEKFCSEQNRQILQNAFMGGGLGHWICSHVKSTLNSALHRAQIPWVCVCVCVCVCDPQARPGSLPVEPQPLC